MKGRKSWAQWMEYFLIHDLGHSDEKGIALCFHGSGKEHAGFFSPASRSICPAQVGQRHLNHDKRRPQNSWRIQIKSQCSHTNKVWFCCLSNTPENAVLLCRKTWSNILWVKASEVALKTTFLSTVFKTLCESIQFKESLDLLWTSKKKLCLFLSAFHI